MLSGGVLSAFLGPLTATYTVNLFPRVYVGSYLMMAVYAICNQIILYYIDFPSSMEYEDEEEESDEDVVMVKSSRVTPAAATTKLQCDEEEARYYSSSSLDLKKECVALTKRYNRSLIEIITQPLFLLACSTSTIAHTVMVMFMAVFTIAMDDAAYSFQDISNVMLLHLLAMFLPGFITGSLIASYGTFAVSVVGTVCFACAVVALSGENLWDYYVGMIFVGLAWNLSFSAGTVMLTSCYMVRSKEFYELRSISMLHYRTR